MYHDNLNDGWSGAGSHTNTGLTDLGSPVRADWTTEAQQLHSAAIEDPSLSFLASFWDPQHMPDIPREYSIPSKDIFTAEAEAPPSNVNDRDQLESPPQQSTALRRDSLGRTEFFRSTSSANGSHGWHDSDHSGQLPLWKQGNMHSRQNDSQIQLDGRRLDRRGDRSARVPEMPYPDIQEQQTWDAWGKQDVMLSQNTRETQLGSGLPSPYTSSSTSQPLPLWRQQRDILQMSQLPDTFSETGEAQATTPSSVEAVAESDVPPTGRQSKSLKPSSKVKAASSLGPPKKHTSELSRISRQRERTKPSATGSSSPGNLDVPGSRETSKSETVGSTRAEPTSRRRVPCSTYRGYRVKQRTLTMGKGCDKCLHSQQSTRNRYDFDRRCVAQTLPKTSTGLPCISCVRCYQLRASCSLYQNFLDPAWIDHTASDG